jgi:hypothetical protein
MKNIYFISTIIITNTYTYLLTRLYINRKYLLIMNKDLPNKDKM